MRAKKIFEKFTEDSDPITDMGIGMRPLISKWMKEIGEKDTDDNALVRCAKRGKTEWVKFLLDAGADIHADDDYALRWASRNGHTEVVKVLLDRGADVHARDNIALQWASQNGHTEIVKILLDAGAKVHADNDLALRWASSKGHIEIVKLLLVAGADVHADNNCALLWASNNGHLEVVKLLLDAGADIHAEDDRALLWASQNGHLEVVKLLLDEGADVHAEDDRALLWASQNGHTEIVKVLKDHMKKNKVVKESLFEKFTEDSDPIHDMGIGAPAIIKNWKTKIKDEDRKRAKENELMWYVVPLREWRYSSYLISSVLYFDSLDILIESGQYKDKNGPIDFPEYVHSILESLNLTQFLEKEPNISSASTWISYYIKPQYLQLFGEAAKKDI